MTYIPLRNVTVNGAVGIADGANLDAFSRVRVSEPSLVFDAQLTYDLQPLVFEPITSGTGAGITYDATNRCALLTFASTPASGQATMQTFEHFRYQAGRSHLAIVTFNFMGAVANVVKFAGYSDGTNGIEFQANGTTLQLVLRSTTTVGNQTVTQANWNIDKLDGTGTSGITLDVTKAQILIIDFQALYVGRVRVGFDIDGLIYYVHEFDNANKFTYPYIATANLPVRCGMTSSATVSTTMEYICCTVISEGGEQDAGGYQFTVEGNVTAGNGTRTHILSLRPKTTFNAIANRVRFALDSVDVLVTGNSPVYWELCLGQAITGTTTYTDVNGTYSAMEYNTAGTISGSPTLVLASGYTAASVQSKSSVSARVAQKYPVTLDAAGVVRAMGTLTLLVTGIGGTAACRAAFNWKEIR